MPGSNLTAVWDVGPGGALVGVYRVGTRTRGFLLENGQYTSIDYFTIIPTGVRYTVYNGQPFQATSRNPTTMSPPIEAPAA